MTEVTRYLPGTPSWIDLGTPDPTAAAQFYSKLFGWTVEEGPPEAGGYRMCMLNGRPVAGLGPQMNPEMPPWWTTYVSVDDADESAANIVAAGGQLLVEPMDVLDVGRMVVALDRSGAMFSIWEPRSHIGSGLVNEPGTLCWNELMTREPTGAIEFYGSVFGWEAKTEEMEHGSYTEFLLNDRSVAGMMPMQGDMWPAELPNHWMVYFAVANTDTAAALVTELGGTVSVPPTDIPPGRFAVVGDPQGAMFSIITMTRSAD